MSLLVRWHVQYTSITELIAKKTSPLTTVFFFLYKLHVKWLISSLKCLIFHSHNKLPCGWNSSLTIRWYWQQLQEGFFLCRFTLWKLFEIIYLFVHFIGKSGSLLGLCIHCLFRPLLLRSVTLQRNRKLKDMIYIKLMIPSCACLGLFWDPNLASWTSSEDKKRPKSGSLLWGKTFQTH